MFLAEGGLEPTPRLLALVCGTLLFFEKHRLKAEHFRFFCISRALSARSVFCILYLDSYSIVFDLLYSALAAQATVRPPPRLGSLCVLIAVSSVWSHVLSNSLMISDICLIVYPFTLVYNNVLSCTNNVRY